MLPSILQQLGPEQLTHLKRLAADVANHRKTCTENDDDVPELIENFEDTANKEIESLATKTAEVVNVT